MTSTVSKDEDKIPSPLSEPNFRRLWLNNIGYFIVSNAQRFVFGLWVLDELQRGEREQGYVIFALGIPALFLVLHAGAWADRLNRKRILLITQLGAAVVMTGAAVVAGTGQANMTWVFVAALLAGATGAIGQPVRSSLIPALVGENQLFGAIALNALAMTASMILGPLMAKLVDDQFGINGAFWFLAILMFTGILFILGMNIPTHERARSDQPRVVKATVEALRHVSADPALRTLFGLLILSSFTINPAVMVTLQAYVKEFEGKDSGDAAPLFAVMGLGIAISSFIVMRKGNMKRKGALFQRAMMTGSTMTFIMGQTNSYLQLVPLAFCMGLAGGFFINMNQGLIQSNTPKELMGRVMGLYTLVNAGLLPIGALALGYIASKAGVGNTISGIALVCFLAVVATYIGNPALRKLS